MTIFEGKVKLELNDWGGVTLEFEVTEDNPERFVIYRGISGLWVYTNYKVYRCYKTIAEAYLSSKPDHGGYKNVKQLCEIHKCDGVVGEDNICSEGHNNNDDKKKKGSRRTPSSIN